MVESSFCCFFPLIRQGKSMQVGYRAGRKIREESGFNQLWR